MATTLFKEVGYSLSKLIEDIDIGEIGLPELQRPFVWPNTKVRDLFDSMYKGFPVGYLLFWSSGVNGGMRQIGMDMKKKAPRLLIVDGQQRLTSLYAVIKGIPVLRDNYRQERIYIAYRPHDQKFEVADATIRRNSEYIADISELWTSGKSQYRYVSDYLKKLRGARPITDEEEAQITENIDRLYDLQNYPFTALELSNSVDEEQVADVFVRINSKGTLLNQADFILTLMSVYWDEGRALLEKFSGDTRQPSRSQASPFNYYIQPDPDQLLRVDVALGFRRARLKHVYSVLRGKDMETEKFSEDLRDRQFEILKASQIKVLHVQDWHEYFKALRSAGYIGGDTISSDTAIIYTYALYLIGLHDYGVDRHTLRQVIARWFFMVSLTSRYSGSSETEMERDLANLRGVNDAQGFINALDQVVHNTLTQDYWTITLPNELVSSSARNPALFAYYAALVLLDARVLFSNLPVKELLDPAIKSNKSALERHHLFPRGYLKRLGIDGTRDTNQIANYALIEWDDNIKISDGPPSTYFNKYVGRYAGEDLDKMLYWHALPQGWQEMTYEDFLVERRKMISQVIRDAYESVLMPGISEDVLNDNVRQIREVIELPEEGDRYQWMKEFFEDLVKRLDDTRPEAVPNAVPKRSSWFSFGAGRGGFYFSWAFGLESDLRIELYIDRGDSNLNKSSFDLLYERRESIEKQIGVPLRWDRLNEKRACRISISTPCQPFEREGKIAADQEWAVETMIHFMDTFQPIIHQV